MTPEQKLRQGQTGDRQSLDRTLQNVLSASVRAGVGLAALPISVLPQQTRNHVEAASRELTRGAASLVRAVADGLDRLAND